MRWNDTIDASEYFTSVLSGHVVPTKWFAYGEQPYSVSVNSSSTSSHPLLCCCMRPLQSHKTITEIEPISNII